MKIKKQKLQAGLTTYVMVMFGMIVILYLMGFTSPWVAYHSEGRIDAEGEVDLESTGAIDSEFSIGTMMVDGIKGIFDSAVDGATENPLIALAATIVAGLGIYILARAGGAYIFAYLIPIILVTIFANIFLFPIEPISGQMIYLENVPLNVILIVFLNLFMFLSIIEFIRGSN